jgi:hypothetical protein
MGIAYSIWFIQANWEQLKASFDYKMQSPTNWINPILKGHIRDATGVDLAQYDTKPTESLYKQSQAELKYMPTLNFNGPVDKATADSFREQLNQHKDDIARIMNGHSNNANRLSFGSDGGF